MLLIDLMAPYELKESIESLRRKLFDSAGKNGFSSKRVMEISRRLDIYMKRYKEFEEIYFDQGSKIKDAQSLFSKSTRINSQNRSLIDLRLD